MKAILIIDLPKHIRNVDNVTVDYKLYNEDKRLELSFGNKVAVMPEKMAVENRWFSEEYSRGWNAYIDEISRKTE